MAYDYFADQDQQEDAQQQQAETGMVQLGPEGGTLESTPQQQGTPGAGGQGTNSGSFTNLNAYLDANKSLGFGGQVAGKVQGVVDTAKGAQQTAEQNFKKAADEGSVGFSDSLANDVRANPTSVVGDQQKFSDFLRARDAEYRGPRDLVDTSDFAGTEKAQRDAAEMVNAAGTEGGRTALLDKLYGSGAGRTDYSGGQKKLDNLLIQNDPNSRAAFQQTRENASKTAQDYEDLKGALTAYGGAKREETAGSRARARGLLGIDDARNEVAGQGEIGKVKSDVQGAVDRRTAERAQELETIAEALRSRNLSGLDPKYQDRVADLKGSRLYNSDPTKWLGPSGDLNANTVASKEQQARMAALYQLAGKENTYLPDAGLAGTMDDEALTGINRAGLQGDIRTGEEGLASTHRRIDDEAGAIRSKGDALQDEINRILAGGSEAGGYNSPGWANYQVYGIQEDGPYAGKSRIQVLQELRAAEQAKLAEKEPASRAAGFYDQFY